MSPFTDPPDPTTMEGNVGVDHAAAVSVIRTGETAEIVPWDEVMRKIEAYSIELLLPHPPAAQRGSVGAYDTMLNLQAALRARYERTGEVAAADLSSGLGGLEGKRVRVLTRDGEVREFIVGVTDGWLPHHIEVRHDGPAVRADPSYKRVWVQGEDY